MAPRIVSSLATAVARPLTVRSFFALAFISAALVLAGCGGGGPDEPAAPPVGQGIVRAQVVGSLASASVTTVSVDALVLKSERRITRTVFEYVYQITVSNHGPALSRVVVQLTAAGPGTTIVDGSVQVGDLAAAAVVTPADTITLRHDRTIPFSQAALVWQVTGSAATAPGVLLDGPTDALAISAITKVNLIAGVAANEIELDAIGRRVARTELHLKISALATVGAVNNALVEFGARITAMTPKVPYLLVRVPDPGTLASLDNLVQALLSTMVFEEVNRAYFPSPDALPENFNPVTLSQFGVIDHLLGVNAPAAWNARAALTRIANRPTLLIADSFGDGAPSLPPYAVATSAADYSTTTYSIGKGHGYHVLGIATADFGGELTAGRLETGLFPSFPGAPLPVSAVDLGWPAYLASTGELSWPAVYHGLVQRLQFYAQIGLRVVVNTSLFFNCGGPCPAQDMQLEAMTWVTAIRASDLEDKFLHATSAGNVKPWAPNDDDARINSPFAAAAVLPLPWMEPNLTNTIVVENVVGRAVPPYEPLCLHSSSKVGGHVSAIGTDVWSYVRPSTAVANFAAEMTGTSMATPQVAALGAYVWALNPSLTPQQVKERLVGTAREVTPPAVWPANCKAGTPAPRINAYGAVLAADDPKAIDGTGTPADAPARLAVLDVANTSGVEGGDGKFDQGDLQVFLSKIPQGVGPLQSYRTGYDWSRYDLSGFGHTGPDRGNNFNLDMNLPVSLSTVSAPEDANMSFNERCVADMQILCYYAYSPMFDASGNRSQRDSLLRPYCDRGQRVWTTEPTPLPRDAMLAVDGRGTTYAAFGYDGAINAGQVVPGGVVLSGPPWSGTEVRAFAVDKRGNMVVAYLNGDYFWVKRYDVDEGWQPAMLVDDQVRTTAAPWVLLLGVEAAVADDAGDAMVAWTRMLQPQSPNGEAVFYEVKVARYDAASRQWQGAAVVAIEDPDKENCLYCDWNDFVPLVQLAMNGAGNATAAWLGFDAAQRIRVVRASRYVSSRGAWDSLPSTLITGYYPTPAYMDVAMDWHGNAFVTSMHWGRGIAVTRFDVESGWGQPIFVANNAVGVGSWVSGAGNWEFATQIPSIYLLAVDACGNALLVFERFEDGYTSLRSKQYLVESGWQDGSVLIESPFNVGSPALELSDPSRSRWLLSLRAHGGRTTSLVTGQLIGRPDGVGIGQDLRLQRRRHQPIAGWNLPAVVTEGDNLCRPPTIDAYGNVAAITFHRRADVSLDQACRAYYGPGVFLPASGLTRLQ